MKRLNTTLSVLLLATAAGAQEVDTSNWACEYCAWPDTLESSFAIGIGWVSDDDYRFGNYSGLEDGEYGLLGGYGVRSTETDYWRFYADHLGLDSRRIGFDGGQPGLWRVRASWSEIPLRLNDTGSSPFINIGGPDLELPGNFVTAPMTGQMSNLDDSSFAFDLGGERERLELGLRLAPPGNLRYSVDYTRDMKEGVRATGAGFMFTSLILPSPVDYVTDQIEARVGFGMGAWSGEISYYGSFFENDYDRLRFDNPFNPVVPGADQGQFALEPDNEFHRVAFSGHYRMSDRSRLSGRLGFGRMTQDEPFLPYTVNPTPIQPLPLGELPRDDLDGEVDVLDLNLGFDTRTEGGLRLGIDYDYYERDNQTPVDEYTFVTQDLYVNPARRNLPFSYERQRLRLKGSYRLGDVRLAGGLAYEDIERTVDEPADTDELDGWLRLNLPLGSRFDARFEVSQAERDGDDIRPETQLAIGENPALRKFAYADRDRSRVSAGVTATPHDAVQLTWQMAWTDDDYDESELGLSASESVDQTVDLTVAPGKGWTAHAFYSVEEIDSRLANEADAGPWFASTEDDIQTYGFGVSLDDLGERGARLSLDYVNSDADSLYDVNDRTAPGAFPELQTRLDGTRLRLDWPLKNGASLVFDYYHESFETSDWFVDGIEQATVFNLLTLGEDSFDYSVDTLAVWYRGRF